MIEQRGRVRVEPCQKRIRVMLGGEVVVDTTNAMYVWEGPNYPQYYVPLADVRNDAALVHATPRIDELPDHVRFEWGAMDAWFEEDEEVFVHPRNPYTRVDILHSSRPVRVEVDGFVIASSSHPTFLFETGLPRRTYFSKVDVRMDLLTPTTRSTMCPYKGTARYWSVQTGDAIHDDLAWCYEAPLRESGPIAGLIAFYDERVELFVDGELQARPKTRITPPPRRSPEPDRPA